MATNPSFNSLFCLAILSCHHLLLKWLMMSPQSDPMHFLGPRSYHTSSVSAQRRSCTKSAQILLSSMAQLRVCRSLLITMVSPNLFVIEHRSLVMLLVLKRKRHTWQPVVRLQECFLKWPYPRWVWILALLPPLA